MDRALALARRSEGLASPNPMVGAVIVRNGQVVGEGFHTYAGRKHAEILALEAAGKQARGATLYVNLEPCCHQGRTGPCTKALIEAGVRRVVVAIRDPNPAVAGRGLRQLRSAGIKVETGLFGAEAQRLNMAFARWIATQKPLVTLKSAMSLDGRIAARAGSTTWLTSAESLAEVHRIRHSADALITGVGTVLADNPRMSDRSGLPRRRPLLRVVLDSHLRLPLRSKLVRNVKGDLLVFTARALNSPRARELRHAGVEIEQVPTRRGRLSLDAVLAALGKRGILHALVEAGAKLNGAFLGESLVDRLILFIAPRTLGENAVPFAIFGTGASRRRSLAHLPYLRVISVRQFGPDLCIEGTFRDVYRDH